MNIEENFILSTDYYKHTHHLQYPKNTKKVFSYVESRGGKFDSTLVFGLQMFLKKYLEGVVVEQWMIEEADEFLKKGFGFNYFNRKGWQRIVDIHGGKIPVKISSVDEGSVIPVKNAILTIENTDEELPWITNFVETMLLRAIWYPTTVATLSYNIKKLINEYCVATGCELSPFHLNDFGARGVSSKESAEIAGCAHLVNFLGTDTIEGVIAAKRYYNADVCGYSVMASEHSTTTIYGKENEDKAYETFINNCPTSAILSLVIDSYDTENAVSNILGTQLKEKILNRTGKLVCRPDSGDPVEMSLKVVSILWDKFGGTVNDKGFKLLNPKVGCIYGDGININTIKDILDNLKEHGFAASNIVFGCGGGLLQAVDRDTMKFALKCSAANVNGEWIDVYKEPKTDSGKNSKRGRLKLVKVKGNYTTINNKNSMFSLLKDELNVIFEDGNILKTITFDQIRNNAKL
jgi:nicotinamide phosphoribosyltransferase